MMNISRATIVRTLKPQTSPCHIVSPFASFDVLQNELLNLHPSKGTGVGSRPSNSPKCARPRIRCHDSSFSRCYSDLRNIAAAADNRSRLSRIWVPTGGTAAQSGEDSHSKLIRAGFVRQAHSGVFHMLPLGRRVQDKLEALIDKYMSNLAASKLALSSISSEEIWTKSGRLHNAGSELFRFRDRKNVRYILSPTHEEEITSLVASTVKSYKELPVRLYQISRKYRDELRPRHGLLRSREFVMKDLYTFDYSADLALKTYHEVREAYSRLFDDLKIPYLVAEADSGTMGGSLSHEFHFPTAQGEDDVISCNSCDYVANEEVAESAVLERPQTESMTESDLGVWRGISRDRLTLINVWYPSPPSSGAVSSQYTPEISIHAIKTVMPELDASIEDPMPFWTHCSPRSKSRRLVNIVDGRLSDSIRMKIESKDSQIPYWPSQFDDVWSDIVMESLYQDTLTKQPLNLLRIRDGDTCPRCSRRTLKVQKAVELGHTFHLGTRYSDPLKAMVTVPAQLLGNGELFTKSATEGDYSASRQVPMQMGCHGIGVSRMIGAVADTLADKKGLNWPRVMAPFEVVVIPSKGLEDAGVEVYDELSYVPASSNRPQLDLVLDDRVETFPWKMQDADLVGYPIIVVVGRRWKKERICEVQCRRLQVRKELPLGSVLVFAESLLSQL